jgi:hypothetical protein
MWNNGESSYYISSAGAGQSQKEAAFAFYNILLHLR